MTVTYSADAPDLETLREARGPVIVEFGVGWCPWCQSADPLIERTLAGRGVTHYRVEDGKGRPLGRAFGVKRWPTLIFLCDGKELARCVRPDSEAALRQALAQIIDT
ncbi:thioredoxin family protein [Salinicola aestuarinus]|uniref:thioredoxin family protein n=1 Tax=Salinicola aestuarinus TaxID=1949082 RepID=UPI001FD9F7DF|nr:thioredoxin family protein [Salinicola aestuarinus]